jgi:hypothetical protein
MREYDDYIKLTRQYLKKYNQIKIAVQNLNDEIRAQEMLLENESIPSVRYGDDAVSGGRGELTSTEAAADRRIKAERRIERMRQEKNELERILRKVDRALEGVSELDCELIRGHYINGESWQELGDRHFCSEKWARDRGGRALREVAYMVFGIYVGPRQMRFVFSP